MEGLFAIREGVRRGSRTSSWAACCLTFAPRHERGLLTLAAHGRTPIMAAPGEYPTAFGGRKVRCESQWKATLVSPNPCAPLQIYSLQHLPRLSFIPTRCSINACFIGQLNDHYPRREKKNQILHKDVYSSPQCCICSARFKRGQSPTQLAMST